MNKQNDDSMNEKITNATNRIEENVKSFVRLSLEVIEEKLRGRLQVLELKIEEIHRTLVDNGLIKMVRTHEEELIGIRPIKRFYWLAISVLTTGVIGSILGNIVIKWKN